MTASDQKSDRASSVNDVSLSTEHENGSNSSVQQKAVQIEENSTLDNSKDIESIDEILKLASDDDGHDGGYGWIVVFGAFMVQVTSFGVISSWGNIYGSKDYFDQKLFSNNSQALVDLSFVGTIALIVDNGVSPIVQVCAARYGIRPTMIVGTILISISLELASFATQVWHLYLTQGIMFGLGISTMYVIVMSVTPQWFSKNRGTALGCLAAGSGFGGLVLPFIMTPINNTLGYAWTYRILGFICLFCDTMACIVVKEKIPRPNEKKRLSSIVQFDVLKNFNFLIFSIASNIILLGYFVPFFFIPAYATHLGLSDSQGSSLVAVSSAMNFVGRLVIGFVSDKIGKMNANIIFTVTAALSNLLIWSFAFTFPTLMGYCVVFGFTCGGYFTLVSPISADILGMEKFPSGLSLLLLSNAIAVFGSNIASAIESRVISFTSTPFLTYKMFTGVTYLTGSLILVFLKFRISKNPFTKL